MVRRAPFHLSSLPASIEYSKKLLCVCVCVLALINQLQTIFVTGPGLQFPCQRIIYRMAAYALSLPLSLSPLPSL